MGVRGQKRWVIVVVVEQRRSVQSNHVKETGKFGYKAGQACRERVVLSVEKRLGHLATGQGWDGMHDYLDSSSVQCLNSPTTPGLQWEIQVWAAKHVKRRGL